MFFKNIIKFTWLAVFSIIFVVLFSLIASTAIMFIQNPDQIGVTFPDRAISDAARLTRRMESEIHGECTAKGSFFEKQVVCEMTRTKEHKVTDTILLEYDVIMDAIVNFNYTRENLE
ncbi:hypothetical protein ELG61_01380 [Rhizobium leguminosarum]|nr:hypothetical protein ELG70_01370 [Rhizobium leguminosarum]TBH69479.1 hypothetical protein ELG61_01380 [Rhizobium leguminosarum]